MGLWHCLPLPKLFIRNTHPFAHVCPFNCIWFYPLNGKLASVEECNTKGVEARELVVFCRGGVLVCVVGFYVWVCWWFLFSSWISLRRLFLMTYQTGKVKTCPCLVMPHIFQATRFVCVALIKWALYHELFFVTIQLL